MTRVWVAVLVVAIGAAVIGLVGCDGDDPVTETSATAAIGEPVTSLGGGVTVPESPDASDAAGGTDSSLVGKWYSEQTGETHEYTADGRLIVTSGDGGVTELTYTADGSNISYLIGGAVVYTGTYAVDDDVLTQVDPDIDGVVFFDRVE